VLYVTNKGVHIAIFLSLGVTPKAIEVLLPEWLNVFLCRIDANLILLVNTSVVPVCMVIIPLCTALSGLALTLGVIGLCMGCIDCLANLQMISIHSNAVAPFLHVSSTASRIRLLPVSLSTVQLVWQNFMIFLALNISRRFWSKYVSHEVNQLKVSVCRLVWTALCIFY